MSRLTAGLIAVAVLYVGVAEGARNLNLDPGPQHSVAFRDLKPSFPPEFDVQRQRIDEALVYLPHQAAELGLFVALPDKAVKDDYYKQLSAQVAAYMLPKEKPGYAWKKLDGYTKMSKFEAGGGEFQGFNGQQRVLVNLRRIRLKEREVVVGYIVALDRGPQARQLFEQNLGGIVIPASNAQAYVIASLTGEKYEDINPDASFNAVPETKRKN